MASEDMSTSSSTKNISPWLETVRDERRFLQLTGNQAADIVVIGGGIAGIMAAFQIAEKIAEKPEQKGKKVILLEKNHIATGDTGLTTGFLTRVPDASVQMLEQKYGLQFVQDLFAATRETQLSLFDLINSKNIDCDFEECSSFFSSYEINDPGLREEWNIYKQANAECELVQNGGANGSESSRTIRAPFKEAVEFRQEGKFHVRKFLFGLLNQKPKNLEIFEESEVLDINIQESQEKKVIIKTENGTVTAEKIITCIGNPTSLFPELTSLLDSNITYVLAAKYDQSPLADDVFWDTLNPYFYYRKIDSQTIVLGGCDIAFDKTSTQKPFEKLEAFLKTRFSTGQYEITNKWSGSIFHTADGLPYAFEHPHYAGKVFVATGFGGNGMVMGTLSGRSVANLALNNRENQSDAKNKLFSLQRTNAEIPKPAAKISITDAKDKKVFTPFANLEEFEKKPMISKTIAGQKIIVIKIDGTFSAIQGNCTHAGGSLSDGEYDGKIIECPLHGARFDVKTGAVKGPPATRPLQKYSTRISGNILEIEIEEKTAAATFADPDTGFKKLLQFTFFSLLFWLVQFALQYYWLTKGEMGGSLLRSFGLAGATYFAIALFMSALFKWWPILSLRWRLRRRVGVAGFIFIVFHVLAAVHFYFDYDLASIYYSLNPLVNPIIFGSIAFPIFFVMAATSTDWAVQKIGPKKWKFIHRFVYLAYVSSIFHFITINPVLLNNPPGYLLLLLTAAALFGQLYWYIKIAAKRKFMSVGAVVGMIIILGTLATAYGVYKTRFAATEMTTEEAPI